MNNENELPTFAFTSEHMQAFEGYQNFVNDEGIVLWGTHKGKQLREVQDDGYLRRVVARCIGNALFVQDYLNGASPDSLRRMIASHPEWEDRFRRHFEITYGITISDAYTLAEVEPLSEEE